VVEWDGVKRRLFFLHLFAYVQMNANKRAGEGGRGRRAVRKCGFAEATHTDAFTHTNTHTHTQLWQCLKAQQAPLLSAACVVPFLL
jgi:hypothetical protein